MKKANRQSLFAIFGACAVLLSACGGGEGVDTIKVTERAVCNPASGPSGTQVTCAMENIDPDCTFFIATPLTGFTQPIEIVLHEDEGAFSFTVPALEKGKKDLYFQCGDSGIRPVGNFEVTPVVTENVVPPATGDENIAPSETGGTGTGTTTGGETTPATEVETPPAPATPTGVSIDTFTVDSVAGSTTLFRTVHVTFAASNAKAAYLWGNVLNRKSKDADESAPCGLQGERYLVTDTSGNPLEEGSANHATWNYLSEGVLCTGSNCRNSSVPTLVPSDKTPNCRVDLLKDDGTVVPSGDFYTRSLARDGKLCLAVQGADDQWKVQCVVGGKLDAPVVALTPNSVVIKPSDKKIAFTLALDAFNATKVTVDGCDQETNDVSDYTGTVHYKGECTVASENKKVTATLTGVGDGNVKEKTYKLVMDKPKDGEVVLKRASVSPLHNKEGFIDLLHSAKRHYRIEDEDGKVVKNGGSGDASWFKEQTLEVVKDGKNKVIETSKIDSTADVNKTKKDVTVDYYNTEWTFIVTDFNDKEYRDSASVADFDDWFDIVSSDSSTHYAYMYDDCDQLEDVNTFDCCSPVYGTGCRHDSDDGVWDCHDYRLTVIVEWKAVHMKSVSIKCWGSGKDTDATNHYYNLDINGSKEDVWSAVIGGEMVECEFTGKTQDGDEFKFMKTWKRDRGYCDGPDISGSDQDDTFND